MRATRWAHATATFLPVATEPREGHAVDALVLDDGRSNVPRAGHEIDHPGPVGKHSASMRVEAG